MALKLKVRALFPALVAALSPLTLVKSGLSYVFGIDMTALRLSLDPFYAIYRIPLTADTVFYFRSDGSNTGRTGLVDSASGAFKDLQALWDYVSNTYDARGFKVTLQASGTTPRTMSAGLATNKGIYGANGAQNVLILGSATPSNFVISTTNADCVSVGALLFGNAQFTIGGFKFQTAGAFGNCINASGGGSAVVYGVGGFPIEFGSCAQAHVVGNHGENLFAGGAGNIISGGALVHASSLSSATVALHGVPITFVGAANSLSFPNGFYDCEGNGTLYIDNLTFTNIAAVNSTTPSGLVASGGKIINYPLTSALPGAGAVIQIGSGRYLATGLEPTAIFDGGTGISTGPGTPNFKARLATAMSGLANGSTQKVLFDTVVFDSGSYWNAASHVYKPLVAGTYRVSFNFVPTAASWSGASDAILAYISKNGTIGGTGVAQFLNVFPSFAAVTGDTAGGAGSTLVTMNGTTDTLEIDISATTGGGAVTWGLAGGGNMVTQVTIERIGP